MISLSIDEPEPLQNQKLPVYAIDTCRCTDAVLIIDDNDDNARVIQQKLNAI